MSRNLLCNLPSPILVTGAAYSGKSDLAQQIMGPLDSVTVIGTGLLDTKIMRDRIGSLKTNRPGGWNSLDVTGDLTPIIEKCLQRDHLLIDSFSLWLAGRLVPWSETIASDETSVIALVHRELDELTACLRKFSDARIVIVTAEAGAGPAPERHTERIYRMLLGQANCQLAALAKTVVDVRCGIPNVIKTTSD